MTWAQSELQETLYSTLTGDAPLMALITGVYDSAAVPEYTVFPYVTIGENQMENRSNHTWRGWSSNVIIHVWYQEQGRGRKKVQDIQAEIDRLLNAQDICVDGWNIVNLRLQTVDVIIDSDNVTLHGIQIFNLLLGEA
jgi:hypothetical protein